MKTLLLSSLLAAAAGLPLTGSAELLVYKGVLTEQFFGANNQENRNWKVLVIVDHTTGNFSRVGYGTLHGVKHYFSSQYTNAHIVDVTGLRGKAGSALTRIPTDCDAQENPGGESVFVQGLNATLTVNTGATTVFPRTMIHRGGGLYHTTSSDLPYLEDFSYILVFNQVATVGSNRAGESLDTATANAVTQLGAQGYSP